MCASIARIELGRRAAKITNGAARTSGSSAAEYRPPAQNRAREASVAVLALLANYERLLNDLNSGWPAKLRCGCRRWVENRTLETSDQIVKNQPVVTPRITSGIVAAKGDFENGRVRREAYLQAAREPGRWVGLTCNGCEMTSARAKATAVNDLIENRRTTKQVNTSLLSLGKRLRRGRRQRHLKIGGDPVSSRKLQISDSAQNDCKQDE
jgi:hypothetical protein